MKRINTIIVDDSQESIDTLTLLLSTFYKEVNIIAAATSVNEALEKIMLNHATLDLLFVNPEAGGFTLLKDLQHLSFKIIFTTERDTIAIRAIRFSALDYLLKPFVKTELDAVIARIVFNVPVVQHEHQPECFRTVIDHRSLFEKLAIPTLTEIRFIDIKSISYMESDNNYTMIFLDSGEKIVSSKHLGHYEELLAGYGFLRVHNSYMINLRHISRYIKGKGGYVELDNGKKIEISFRRKDDFLKQIGI